MSDTVRPGESLPPSGNYELVMGLGESDVRRIYELRERFGLETDEEAVRLALRFAHGRHVADRRVKPSEDDDFFAEMSRKLEHEKDRRDVDFARIAARNFRSGE